KLPVQIKTLCDLGLQPGGAILKKDIYFSVEEVEALDPQKVQQHREEAALIEQLQKENSFLKSENEKLTLESKNLHPALNPDDSRFAPEIVVALKINDYVEQNKYRDGAKPLSHSALADEFLQCNGVTA